MHLLLPRCIWARASCCLGATAEGRWGYILLLRLLAYLPPVTHPRPTFSGSVRLEPYRDCISYQTRSRSERLREDSQPLASSPGRYMIFTFGAVATSTSPLKDFSQPSQTFRGLRCYTETWSNLGRGSFPCCFTLVDVPTWDP